MNPLVSIIIPTYKGEESIGIALQSIAKQTYSNLEVIVSDDNGAGEICQKKTEEIVNKFNRKLNIIYLINEHKNGSYARNKGLDKAKGEIVCLLDDDDFYLPNYIEEIVNKLNQNEDIDFCFCNVAFLAREGFYREVRNKVINSKELLFLNQEIGTGSNICFRRRVYEEDGGFDEEYLRYQDLEFIVKKLNKYKSIWINELLIVKYYSKFENYLNIEKNLCMQKKLQDDVIERKIIGIDELPLLIKKQHHIIFTDMMIKNMPKKDVKKIYTMLKSENGISGKDTFIYNVYNISIILFNICFKIVSSLNREKKDSSYFKQLKILREKYRKSIYY